MTSAQKFISSVTVTSSFVLLVLTLVITLPGCGEQALENQIVLTPVQSQTGTEPDPQVTAGRLVVHYPLPLPQRLGYYKASLAIPHKSEILSLFTAVWGNSVQTQPILIVLQEPPNSVGTHRLREFHFFTVQRTATSWSDQQCPQIPEGLVYLGTYQGYGNTLVHLFEKVD